MPRSPLYEKAKAVVEAYDDWQASRTHVARYLKFQLRVNQLRSQLDEIDESLSTLEDIRSRNIPTDG